MAFLYEFESPVVRKIFSLTNEAPYQIEEELGRGTFSVVKRAVSQTGKSVAIKEFFLDKDNVYSFMGDLLMKRFERNSFLAVPDNIYFYENESPNGVVVGITYPLMDGDLESFSRKIKDEKIRYKVGIELFKHLLQGVFFMIDNGIYHQDIKPANMLYSLDESGEVIRAAVKFSDFGIINLTPCISDPSKRDYEVAKVGGTPIFFPPESRYKNGKFNYDATTMFSTTALSIYQFIARDYDSIDRFQNEGQPIRFQPSNELIAELNDDQRSYLTFIEQLCNSNPEDRIALVDGMKDKDYRQQITHIYPSAERAAGFVNEILEIFAEDPINDPDYSGVEDFVGYCFQSARAYKVFNLIDLVKFFDCMARLIVKMNYYDGMAKDIQNLIRIENLVRVGDLNVKNLISILSLLDFTITDCSFTEMFYCLNDSQIVDEADLMGTIVLYFKDFIMNPIAFIRTYLKEKGKDQNCGLRKAKERGAF